MGGLFANLFADYGFRRVEEIPLDFLRSLGTRGLIIDIDNTLTSWETPDTPPAVRQWVASVKNAGLPVVLLSNGLRGRQARVAEELQLPVITSWLPKPFPAGFRAALRALQLVPTQVVSIGDIVFTDIWGANRQGITTILVDPRSDRDFPGTLIWRLLERVFRLRRPKRKTMK